MKTKYHYLEDYMVGEKGETNSRTITEADIVNFACLTGDFSRLHVDRHYAKNMVYGERVAHGILGTSLATGMLSLSAPHVVGRGIPDGYLWHIEVKYRKGITLGDTIKTLWTIVQKTNDKTHPGFGTVKTTFQLINQADTAVYDGTITTLVKSESAKDTRLTLEPGTLWEMPSVLIDPERVNWSEDLPIGVGGESDGRTITETDVVNYGCIVGDYNPQNFDAEYAKSTSLGERSAQGMLIFGIANGMRGNYSGRYRTPKSKIAGHLGDNISFLMPVRIGDTLRCRYKIIENRVSKSRPEANIVVWGLQMIDQRNHVVQEASVILMSPSRERATAQLLKGVQ